jgi:hypothetical protein
LSAENANGILTDAVVWAEALAPAQSRPVARERLKSRFERFAMRDVMVVLLFGLATAGGG